MLDIDDQNSTYVLASKGTHVAYLNWNLWYHQGMQPIQKVHLKIKLILNRVNCNQINTKWNHVAPK